MEFGPTIATSIRDSWSRVICAVQAQARRAYTRHVCLVQRMQYVLLSLFAKIWHVSQIFPLPLVQAQQLTTICSWYLWQAATFRVPLGTLQRPKKDGGWGLPNVAVKCKTLLYHRIMTLGARGGTVTSDLLHYWHVQEAFINPPYAPRIPAKLVHLRHFVINMAYVAPLAPDEKSKHFNQRIYNVLHMLAMNGSPPTEMRIVRKFPHTAWNQVWKNLHASPVSDKIKSTWYKALHNLIPTNNRLAAINPPTHPHARRVAGLTPCSIR